MKITKQQLTKMVREELAEAEQMTLNQDEVDTVAAMAKAIGSVWNQFRRLKSVPQEWLDDSTDVDRYSRLEKVLFDAEEELKELADDMENGGV